MQLERKYFFLTYDLDATSLKYGRLGDASGDWVPGTYGACTSGSSTTVTAAVADKGTFAGLAAGTPMLFMVPPDTVSARKVATVTSDNEIAVDSAITLGTTGRAWKYLPWTIGTAATVGWHRCESGDQLSVYVDWTTKQANQLDVQVEGLVGENKVIVLDQQSYTATGRYEIKVTSPVIAIRVGIKAGSTFANTDSITVWMEQRLPSLS